MKDIPPLVIAERSFQSRLLVGTGKFPSTNAMTEAIEASGAEIVTVALRRVDLDNPQDVDCYYVCSVCGYTCENEPPGTCPVCGAKDKAFSKVE